MKHASHYALTVLQFVAEFLTQHVFYTVSQVSLTAIFACFMLYTPVQRDFSPVMRGVFSSMETYLKLKSYISLGMGITNGTALAIVGLEIPVAWGLMTFLANFIPNIGGPTMSVLPCVIALLDVRKTLFQVAAAFGMQFFLHFTIANFVEPVIFGTTEEIHSVVVILGLSFFGYIWGITGMFLSVPLLFAIHAWLDTIARTTKYSMEAREDARFIMGMLEGTWLSESLDNEEEQSNPDVTLLTGEIEAHESPDIPFREPGRPSTSASLVEDSAVEDQRRAGQTIQKGIEALFESVDRETGEIRCQGLLLRWIFLLGIYFVLFGMHIQMLIRPSSQLEAMPDHNSSSVTQAFLVSGQTSTTEATHSSTPAITVGMLMSTQAPSESDGKAVAYSGQVGPSGARDTEAVTEVTENEV
jgi:hypothetical protein